MNLTSVSLNNLQRPDPAQMREKLFKQADTDNSGTISKDEWKTATQNAPKPPNAPDGSSAPSADEMFAKIDTDGDGQITKTEMEAADKAREEEMKTKDTQMGAGSTNGFSGSADLMKNLLETLQKADDSSASIASSDAEATKQKLIKELLAQLQEKNGQYSAAWAAKSNSSVSLFSTTV